MQALQRLADKAELSLSSSAVVCRARKELESLGGKANYVRLKGKAKALATAAFLRDSRHDYRGAYKIVTCVIRELTGDDPAWQDLDSELEKDMTVALAIWKFVKDPEQLPSLSGKGDTWVFTVRTSLASLIEDTGLQCDVKLGHHIKTTGLNSQQKLLPLLEPVGEVPLVRQDTIHQVKGESIDAVLAIGSTKFWNSVVKAVEKGENTEERRLAYVAMTRARHLLVVGLPKKHFDKHVETWKSWGFKLADETLAACVE